jgi:translation initiation factor IF-1
MQLIWQERPARNERARVVDWTCPCRTTSYELCRLGGQSHIRRTRHTEQGDVVIHETHQWSFTKADEVWKALLEGDVV